MPAPIPLEPPVTRATLPVNDLACIPAMNILQVIDSWSSTNVVLDYIIQNKIQKLFCYEFCERTRFPAILNGALYRDRQGQGTNRRRSKCFDFQPPLSATG